MLKLKFHFINVPKVIKLLATSAINITGIIISKLYQFILHIIRYIKPNFIFLLYFYGLFYTISLVKLAYVNKIAIYLVNSGFIRTFTLFEVDHPILYSSLLGIIVLIILLVLTNYKINNYYYSGIVFSCFLILGFSLLLFNIFEILSFIFFILYSGLIAIIFGLNRVKLRPDMMDNIKITDNIKLELLKIRMSDWWRGLTILTSILIALFITALVSWVLNPPPDSFKIISDYTLKTSFFLFVAALPGLIYIYLRILGQIDYLEKCILELGTQA